MWHDFIDSLSLSTFPSILSPNIGVLYIPLLSIPNIKLNPLGPPSKTICWELCDYHYNIQYFKKRK